MIKMMHYIVGIHPDPIEDTKKKDWIKHFRSIKNKWLGRFDNLEVICGENSSVMLRFDKDVTG